MRYERPILLTAMFAIAAACGYLGYHYVEAVTQWSFGENHGDIYLGHWISGQRAAISMQFAAACAFAGAATIAPLLTFRLTSGLTSLFMRASSYVLIAVLAFACAILFLRYQCSLLAVTVRGYRHQHSIAISPNDVPIIRVPLITGVVTLTAAFLMAAVARRFANRSLPPKEDK